MIFKPIANNLEVSLFDVYTTTYFLSEATTLEEHRVARAEEEADPEEPKEEGDDDV